LVQNLTTTIIEKESYIALGDVGNHIFLSHILTQPVTAIYLVSAGMYRVLSNIQEGAASFGHPLRNCG